MNKYRVIADLHDADNKGTTLSVRVGAETADPDIQNLQRMINERRALGKGERVCRTCKWLDKAECCRLLWVGDPTHTFGGDADASLRVDEPTEWGCLEILAPDDFGCNKWGETP